VSLLRLGVIGTSAKENEHRLPLHPEHLSRLAPAIAGRTTLEHDYAARFGINDADLAPHVAGFATRDEILRDSDVVVLPKPQHEDVAAMHAGQVLWGWPHCVQDATMTQLAIDRGLTLIAFEAMNHWTADGHVGLHVFHKNNELAGYCSVLQAMELVGITGDYGRRLSAVVIGFGATARGAVTALKAHGVGDVAVLTTRGVAAVGSPIHSVRIRQFDHDPDDPSASHVITDQGRVPLAPYLAENDIVVNCTLQDTAAPLTYLRTEDLADFRRGSLIVDVSCDEGMGFSWAVPTTFDDPMFTVGDRVHYYAVDHSPSYLWNSATWENSEALLPFMETVLSGPDAWDGSETIRRAIEIRDGRIQNPAITAFQGR
jgi:alanine dehydrogenase